MKRFIFAFIYLVLPTIALAQTPAKPLSTATNPATTVNTTSNTNTNQTSPTVLKAKKDNYTFEGTLNIQLMNQPLGIGFEEIKMRYFISEKKAYRGRGMVTMSTINKTISGTNGESAKVYETNQSFTVAGGFEKHIKSKNHISPYYGIEAQFSIISKTIDGSNTDDAINFKKDYKYSSANTSRGIYLGGVIGLDYYLNSDFYIGTELRYGYQSMSLGNLDKSVTGPLSLKSGESLGTNTSLAMSYTNGIRIGYKF